MADRGDNASEFGEDMYANPDVIPMPGSDQSGSGNDPSVGAIRRGDGAGKAKGWGKGPIPVDKRKYRYDVTRGRSAGLKGFTVTKVDRMSAVEAGNVLEEIHKMFGIGTESESRLYTFDRALWFEHSINGASLMQPGRGEIVVDGVSFDIQPLKIKLGIDQRRFFRAFADDIAQVNKEILDSYDPYDVESVEKVGFIRQIAAARGLQKYPHLIHDSSDACLDLSYDERAAVANSKRVVLESSSNQADSMLAARVPARASPYVGTPVGGS